VIDARALLWDLKRQGFLLTPAGRGSIRVTPASRLPPELAETIRANKRALLAELRGQAAGVRTDGRGVRLARQGERWVAGATAGALTEPERQMHAADKTGRLTVVGFEPDLALLISWFRQARAAGRLPDEPFTLAPWARVVDPARFYAALEIDIAIGPCGARARLGGLASGLRRLRSVTGADRPGGGEQ
jgi:hypothetical protein